MYLLVIAWAYVVLMMCLAEATSPQGTVLGAFFTFALYGALPISIVIYLMSTPLRRKKAQALAEAALRAGETGETPLEPEGQEHGAAARANGTQTVPDATPGLASETAPPPARHPPPQEGS